MTKYVEFVTIIMYLRNYAQYGIYKLEKWIMPGDMQENPVQITAEMDALVEKLPGVQACRMLAENGILKEIHILSDDSRSPKQIARDVQSALMAQFGLCVDHRLISIAQIPCAFAAEKNAPAVSARLVCDRLSTSRNKTEFEAAVSLALGDKICKASDQGRATERQRIIGRAAAGAINEFLTDSAHVCLRETGETMLDGRKVMLASVVLEGNRETEHLVGAAFEKEDADMAVVHAVLDAINRRIRF